MHELSITRSMMEIVEEELVRHGLKRLTTLRIRVGELAAVEPEALRFCFEACVKGTAHEGALLCIENVPLTGRCERCSVELPVEGFVQACPECGGALTRTGGHELDIISMEAD